MTSRCLVVNADDLGYGAGIDRGIVEAHVGGVVTSASLMTGGPSAADGAAACREHPALSLGLHWVAGDPGEDAVGAGFERQLEAFQRLVGRPPTHVDSHHDAHLDEQHLPVLRELAESLGVPLRGAGGVAHVRDFYGAGHVSVAALQRILRTAVGDGWTELGCHPGYVEPGHPTSYREEREVELRTLTDPRVRETIAELGIRLVSFAGYRAEQASNRRSVQ